MHAKNLIVPVVGNFAGPQALRAVGSFLRDRGATVTAFYLSNVEGYLARHAVVGLLPERRDVAARREQRVHPAIDCRARHRVRDAHIRDAVRRRATGSSFVPIPANTALVRRAAPFGAMAEEVKLPLTGTPSELSRRRRWLMV